MFSLLLRCALVGFTFLLSSYNCLFASSWSLLLENKGQMTDQFLTPVPFVYYKSSAPGLDVYVTEKGLTYVFLEFEKEEGDSEHEEGKSYKWQRVDLNLKNANIDIANIARNNPAPGDLRYYHPHCAEGITGVREYESITVHNVYPDIDWLLEVKNGILKYSFIVKPGGDYKNIQLQYQGAGLPRLINNNQIQIATDKHTLTEGELVCFYNKNDSYINSSYQLRTTQTNIIDDHNSNQTIASGQPSAIVTIELEEVDPTQTYIIDPPLEWATYYGGSGTDGPMSAASNSKGDIATAGYHYSAVFPVYEKVGAYNQGVAGSNIDPFILMFNEQGERVWATYFGGSLNDEAWTIAFDKRDNLIVGGYTISGNFPLKDGDSYFKDDAPPPFSQHGFLAKFDSIGKLLWSTYIGGSDYDVVESVAIDVENNIVLTGHTKSTDLPFTNAPGVAQPQIAGLQDVFVMKFNECGEGVWATYFGGDSTDVSGGITTRANGNILVTGHTFSSNFTTQSSGGYIDNSYSANEEGYIFELTPNGALVWSTFIGGVGRDEPNTLAFDLSGNLYLAGISTTFTGFPVLDAGGYYRDAPDARDAFILKFDENNVQTWGTFLGGFDQERIECDRNIAVDNDNNLVIAIKTLSDDMDTVKPADDMYYDNNLDMFRANDHFIARFDPATNQTWGTYFGGDGDSKRESVVITPDNNLILVGEWNGGGFDASLPITKFGSAYIDSTQNGDDDIFIARFNLSDTKLEFPLIDKDIVFDTIICTRDSFNLQAPGLGSYVWSTGDSAQNISVFVQGDTTYTVVNVCLFNSIDNGTYTFNLPDTLPTVSNDTSICEGEALMISSAGGDSYSWNTGETDAQINIAFIQDTTYTVIVAYANSMCLDTLSVSISALADSLCKDSILIEMLEYFIPNALSLQSNNNRFPIIYEGIPSIYNLKIYNTKGALVFESDNPAVSWLGLVNGKTAVNGVYVYSLSINDQFYTGNITVLN